MFLDALSFLEEEREAWRPFEQLADLSDADLDPGSVSAAEPGVTDEPVAAAGIAAAAVGPGVDSLHGWSPRDLMVHLSAWQERVLQAAKELALGDASPTIERSAAEWNERGDAAVNAEITAAGRALTVADVRNRFVTLPGEMRGYLTVVPETRWVKHPQRMEFIIESTIDHYDAHAGELAAVLERVGPSADA